MELIQFYKRLGKLIALGHGRRHVTVAKDTFTDNRESDGCTILPVVGLGIKTIRLADDDGGTAVNKDGSERFSTVLILAGGSGANSKGELLIEGLE